MGIIDDKLKCNKTRIYRIIDDQPNFDLSRSSRKSLILHKYYMMLREIYKRNEIYEMEA